MENFNLSKNEPVLSVQAMEDWSKPEMKVIAVGEITFGNTTSPGSDCGHYSGGTCF